MLSRQCVEVISSLRSAPNFGNGGFQLCFLDPSFFALRTGLTQKLLELLELGRRNDLKNHSVSLANDYELVALVESEIISDLFRECQLAKRHAKYSAAVTSRRNWSAN